MKRTVILPTAIMMVLMIGSASFAQTGPVGPSSTPASPVIQNNNGQMLPDRLAETLRKMGHLVEVRKEPNNQVFVIAKFLQDGWRYQVEFEYTIDQRGVFMVCQLGVPASRLSATQMTDLLRKCYEFHPFHFAVHPITGMLLLESPSYSTLNLNETNVQSLLAVLVKDARDTHLLWNIQ